MCLKGRMLKSLRLLKLVRCPEMGQGTKKMSHPHKENKKYFASIVIRYQLASKPNH